MKKTYTYFDWAPVVRSLILTLKKHGVTVVGAGDGEEDIVSENTKELAAHATGCDEGFLYVKTPDTPEGKRKAIYLVLGNEPWETVCDHTVDDAIDKAVDEFSDKWENRKCPTKVVER